MNNRRKKLLRHLPVGSYPPVIRVGIWFRKGHWRACHSRDILL